MACAGYEYTVDRANNMDEESCCSHNLSSNSHSSPIGEIFGNLSYKLVLKKLPDSASALAILFQIDSPGVFEGGNTFELFKSF